MSLLLAISLIIHNWELDYAEKLCKSHKGIELIIVKETINFVECVDGVLFKLEQEI